MSSEHDYDGIEAEARGEFLDVPEPSTEDSVERFDAAQDVPKQDVTDEMLRNDVERADSWLVYNKGLEQIGFSPADRLTTGNVDSLERAYSISTENNGLETNPIVVPSDPPVMYYTVSGSWSVHAANARTGEKLWEFQAGLPKDVKNLDLPVNRGAAVYRDKVYLSTPEPGVVAVDRYTGEKQWQTNLKVDGQMDNRLFLTQAPVVFDGTLLVGESSDYATFTTISALDAESGEVKWQKKTAPENEWVGDTWKFASAASWMSPSVDPKSGTAFFSVGNPDPMNNGLVRPGPNRESNTLHAVDVESGDVKWSSQISPHDLWDYDVHATSRVFDMEVDGETKRVVSVAWKAGWLYVFDVETGVLVERTKPFAKQGGPAFLSLPPAGEENKKPMFPSNPGATEWPPDTYSPKTGLQYVGANNVGNNIWYDPDWSYSDYNRDGFAIGGGIAPVEGTKNSVEVTAVDPASGDIVWEQKLDDVNPDWPATRLYTGGTTSTAGNLVFHGSSGGHLHAFDAESGDQLWKGGDGNRITASPITWDDPASGEQFVSVAIDGDIVTFSGGS